VSQLIGLGRAHDVWYLKSKKAAVTKYSLRCDNCWLVWAGSATRGTIQLVNVEQRAVTAPRFGTHESRLYRRFHGSDPSDALFVTTPAPLTPYEEIGLVVAIAYDAQDMGSATKGDRPYRHHFGDDGDGHKPPYPSDRLPALCLDARGNLLLQRRPGNTWRLDDWLRG